MDSLKIKIAKLPVIGRTALTAYRAKLALGHFYHPMLSAIQWTLTSRETTNFTYDLDETNKNYLISLIATVLKADFREIEGYVREIDNDSELKAHISQTIVNIDRAFLADTAVFFGRRVGWYAFVRATKPKVIVETGVDKGLGSCVLAAALKRNSADGFQGRYYGTDINPKAGYLLAGDYKRFGSILYGDSIQSLLGFRDSIDLFINDSDHSAEYEAREYAAVAEKLSPRAIILGDNSHSTEMLLRFSRQMGRAFVFFQERPAKHWYPGAGIGVSFCP